MNNVSINDDFIDLIINDQLYDIREDGTIWTLQPKSGPLPNNLSKLIWRRLDRDHKGYKIATYQGKFLKVHRIVYRKFIGLLDPLLEINHKDGIKTHNYPDNLELLTQLENLNHAIDTGLIDIGENAENSILKESDVIDIKRLLKLGIKGSIIAKKYSVGKYLISNIKRGTTWNHVVI